MRALPADQVHPLLVADARWTGDGVELDLGRRVVTVEGEPARLRDVLGACDGRTTVDELAEAHGPDTRELLEGLLGTGALVDSEEAWRRFHRWSDNPPSLLRATTDADAAELWEETFRPREPLGGAVALEPCDTAVGRIARRRASGRAADQRPLTWPQLGALLTTMYGPADSRWLTVASGGALYPLAVHVLIRRALGPLEPGIWWYDPWRGGLHLQRAGRPELEPLMLSHDVTDPLLARGEPLIALSADLRRPSRRYGARGYRLALMEAGAVMQNAYLVGAELDVPVRACAGYIDTAAGSLLELPDGVVCLLLMFAGA
jgi:SagB-type dehydrogenase family enzyme